VQADVQSLIQRAYDALDAAGITWCSLHGGDDLFRPVNDVDLLVGPEHRSSLEEEMVGAGFLPIVTFASGGHTFFSGYAQGRRILIDAVAELSFGPQGSPLVNWLRPRFETHAARACLSARVRDGLAWVLAPEDEFWVLLLGCVVDKGEIVSRHARRLLELLPYARTDRPIARVVEESCPPGWTSRLMVEAVRGQRWGDLVDMGSHLARRSTGRRPVASRARWFVTGMRRLAGNLRKRGRSGLGLSVAVLGPDGAGKSTLCSRIEEMAPMSCRVVYMGLWQRHPRGWWDQAAQVLVRPLRIWFAYVAGVAWRLRGRVVVFDRYSYDALLPPAPPFVGAKRIYFSALAALCPDARLALLLDAPLCTLRSRRPHDDPEALERLRSGYLSVASRVAHLEIVDAARDADAVLDDALSRIVGAQVAAIRRRRYRSAHP
jgi:thymidylate kinase